MIFRHKNIRTKELKQIKYVLIQNKKYVLMFFCLEKEKKVSMLVCLKKELICIISMKS